MLNGCGPHSPTGSASGLPPLSPQSSAIGDKAVTSIHNIYADARGKSLSDGDLDQYISAPLSSSDRQIAHKIMRLMPPMQRGDFVYLGADGHAFSNNPNLLANTSIGSKKPQVATSTIRPSRSTSISSTRRRMWSASQCSPPNPPANPDGVYTRDVADCGFDAGWAFVNVGCGATNFAPNDDGELYFEILGSEGSLVEGGLEYYNDQSIAPHFRSTAAPGNGIVYMQNNTVRYACGQTLAIWHGITSDGSMTFTEVGQVPSNLDPQTAWMNEQIVTLNNASWMFYQAPGDFHTNPNQDGANWPSPCTSCSVSKMTAIAQGNVPSGLGYIDDGSYFGTNGQYNEINWLEVGFGNWASDCTTGTSLCTFDVASDPNVYYGGTEAYPDDSTAQSCTSQTDCSSYVGQTGWGPYESWAGIALPGSGVPAARTPAGKFTEPLPPPPCNADSYGYCAASTVSYDDATCYIWTYSVHTNSYYWQAHSLSTKYGYVVYQSQRQAGIATKTVSRATYGCTTSSTSWSPSEPRVTYNDPNLP